MSNISATITVHRTSYQVEGRSEPRHVELAVVRRRAGRKTTRVVVVDAGAATVGRARQVALGISHQIEVREVEHPHLGTFSADDAGRDAMLAAVRGLDLGIGRLAETPRGGFFAGSHPASLVLDA